LGQVVHLRGDGRTKGKKAMNDRDVLAAASYAGTARPSDGRIVATRSQSAAERESRPKPRRESLTDLGNARRLVALFGGDLRYCYSWGKWLVWDRNRWRIDDVGGVEDRAKKTTWSIYSEAAKAAKSNDEDDRLMAEKLAKHAKASQSVARVNAMISMAHSESGVPIKPPDLDADRWLLNVSNGTLDLRTGELRPHRREDLITKLAPVDYDARAPLKVWLDFLERILAGNVNLIRFLQRCVGYALTGDVREQVIFFLHGTGANGKSTLLNVLLEILGDYAAQLNADALMMKQGESHPTALTDLFGRRFVSSVEVEEGKRLAEVLVKQLTGGDRVRARRMREDFWEFAPTHKVFLAANHKPVIRGTDHAIWRRIKLIPFEVTIPDDQQDKKLPEKLRNEFSGILRWAVEGCLEWKRHGLGEPDEVRLATAGYRAEMDLIGAFIAECCVVNAACAAKASDLYGCYSKWAEQNGEHPMAQRNFGLRLSERGFERKRGTGGSYWWNGIGLGAE
jgi:putative DNA primase/helicase